MLQSACHLIAKGRSARSHKEGSPLDAQLTLRWVVAVALVVAGAVGFLRMAAVLPAGEAASVVGLALLAVAALLAGIGLALRARWAAPALLALGAVFAATRLYDAFVLGIRPWLVATLAALAGLIAAIWLAALARKDQRSRAGAA
jgi:hypothetical protein